MTRPSAGTIQSILLFLKMNSRLQFATSFIGHKETDPSMMQKTPVSWLHELCTRNNVTPKYDLLQIEGAVHEPIFQYRLHLEFNSKTYEGNGSEVIP